MQAIQSMEQQSMEQQSMEQQSMEQQSTEQQSMEPSSESKNKKPLIKIVGTIQHKVNYDIKNGIKNTSPWKQLLDTLKSDSSNLMNVATLFATQLKTDEQNMLTNNDVT